MKTLILDYETRSEVDIKKAGACKYAEHSSTELLCYAIKWCDQPVVSSTYPNIDLKYLKYKLDEADLIVAHNALFERVITRKALGVDYPSKKWICTASMARVLSLPGKLDMLTQVLNLGINKDMAGHRLMLKMSKPRKATKNDTSKWHESPDDLRRLTEYCITDVEAEALVYKYLLAQAPFNKTEREAWCLDQEINLKGFKIDAEFCNHVLNLVDGIELENNRLIKELTFGAVDTVNQRDKLIEFLNGIGSGIETLTKDAVKKHIAESSGLAKDILELRQDAAKSSIKKYKAFLDRVSDDGSVKDILVYHSASTGRFAGSGVQPQNFPRGTVELSEQDFEIVKSCDLDEIKLLYKAKPLDLFSSMLRGVIVARKGKELIAADYSAIEARVLFWLAGETKGLDIFRQDEDIYKDMAASIYNKKYDDITKLERQLGKTTILGLGYQMGVKKFKETCAAQGVTVPDHLIEKAHSTYRAKFSNVPLLWYKQERAAKWAVFEKRPITVDGITWQVKGDFLFAVLPGGKRLAYYKPEINVVSTSWGEPKEVLTFLAVNSISKKFERESTYGGKIVENLVQAISRNLMIGAMLSAHKKGLDVLLTVHDELVCEVDKGSISVKDFESIITELPTWAEGLPLAAEGWAGYRYRK